MYIFVGFLLILFFMDFVGVFFDCFSFFIVFLFGVFFVFSFKDELISLGLIFEGLERVEKEVRVVVEVNYLGIVFVLSCFV